MTHENFENALLLRAAGELPPGDAAGLAAHLAECRACRSFEAALTASSAAAKLTLEDPSPALVRRTRAVILSNRESPAPSLPWNWIPAGLGMALATLLLMVGRQHPRPPLEPAPEAALAQEQDELSQTEADLEELEDLLTEAEFDLSENVTGGDL